MAEEGVMTVTKVCEHCGEEFEARSLLAKYCSDSCRNKAYRERRKKWKEEAQKEQGD